MKKEKKEKEEVCKHSCEGCNGCGSHEENMEEGVLTFLDEEGKEVRFDILDVVSMDEKEYLVVMPISGIELNDADGDVMILEIKQEDGEEVYDTVEDDAVADKVFEKFQEEYYDDADDEDDECDCEDCDDECDDECDCDDCNCDETGSCDCE